MSVAPNRTRIARLVAYAVIQNIIIKPFILFNKFLHIGIDILFIMTYNFIMEVIMWKMF